MGDGLLLAFGGEMEIDGGGFQAGVSQITLNGGKRDAGFEQMGGIGVP